MLPSCALISKRLSKPTLKVHMWSISNEIWLKATSFWKSYTQTCVSRCWGFDSGPANEYDIHGTGSRILSSQFRCPSASTCQWHQWVLRLGFGCPHKWGTPEQHHGWTHTAPGSQRERIVYCHSPHEHTSVMSIVLKFFSIYSSCYKQRMCSFEVVVTTTTQNINLMSLHPKAHWYAGMMCTRHWLSFSLTGDWTIFMRCLLILVTMAGMSTTSSWAACSRAMSMAISVPVLPTPALQGDSHHHNDEPCIPFIFPQHTHTHTHTHMLTLYTHAIYREWTIQNLDCENKKKISGQNEDKGTHNSATMVSLWIPLEPFPL